MSEYLFGIHSIHAVLEQSPEKIIRIYTLHEQKNARIQALLDSAKNYHIPIELVQKKSLEKMAKDDHHQNIIAAYKPGPSLKEADLWRMLESMSSPLLLMLDGVTDPHNLGACLRSADAAGVHAVIIPKHRSAGLTPVSRKVAAGAAEVVPLIQVSNLAQTLDKLKEYGIWSVGMSDKATTDFYALDFNVPTVIVMGNPTENIFS